ncbi:MAG TPA: MBL fold metallo-hydrolase [Bacteroidia bacterium]
MSLFISSINSGSNGNCYYVGNNQDAVLVDAGISCRETEKRMKRLGLNIQKVKAIFISHEHSDHIKGVEVLSKKFQLPVFISERTLRNSGLKIARERIHSFSHGETIEAGSLRISAFSKWHDAADPFSFTVSHDGTCVGVFTDIGAPCENVVKHFSKCHAAFLEANYDEQMLTEGRYPAHLKKRIKSDKGHLSNAQALRLFLDHRSEALSHLLLSHLSKENNRPELVHSLFLQHAGNTSITVASRYSESPVYKVDAEDHSVPVSQAEQLSLF